MTATTSSKPPPLVAHRLVPGDVLKIADDGTALVYRLGSAGLWVFQVKLDPKVKPVAAVPAASRN